MPRVISTENPGADVRRYLRRWSNTSHLEQQIQARHPGTAAEKRRRKARDISATVSQGIELLETAAAASVLTKPLPLFYAAEAFVKAASMMSDPTLEATDFRAHGLRGVKAQRYFIRTLSCQVANPGSDVWSRLTQLLNGDWTRLTLTRDGEGSINDYLTPRPGPPPPPATELVLGELLRHIPELAEDLPSASFSHPYVVHVRDMTVIETTAPVPTAHVTFTLRHAHNAATKQMLIEHEGPRGYLRSHTRTGDRLDVLFYSAVANTLTMITRAPPVEDIFGELYSDFARSRQHLSEFATYYAALFILADAVRYQGQWTRLLDEHPSEAVLIERFMEIALRKLPNLTLNHLDQGVYLFKVGGA